MAKGVYQSVQAQMAIARRESPALVEAFKQWEAAQPNPFPLQPKIGRKPPCVRLARLRGILKEILSTPGRIFSTKELARALGVTYPAAYSRLRRMLRQGLIARVTLQTWKVLDRGDQ